MVSDLKNLNDRSISYWEIFDVVLKGESALDSNTFFGQIFSLEQAEGFLKGYGFDVSEPVESSELFGIFQESLQFIKRYFLKDGNPNSGLDLQIPMELYQLTDIRDLFIMPSQGILDKEKMELSLWATVVLKVMHTILHADKDLRYRYFSTIQTQIFDLFYRYLHRDEQGNLFLKSETSTVPLIEFQTKAKKSRESIIVKLLHKKENVAEELFDRIGVRFITKTKFDVLRVIKFLHEHHIIMIHNIKTSRSFNSLVDIEKYRRAYEELASRVDFSQIGEEEFLKLMNGIIDESMPKLAPRNENKHTLHDYRAVHFTGRQLIQYTNPFMKNFAKVRSEAKNEPESELSKMILKLDTSTITKVVRFFYPFEVQITDAESHQKNTEGEASHQEYKANQQRAAMIRIFKPLLDFKKIGSQEIP